ncbi:hypothetical protein GBA52_028491 [Prunus armeniaca]|nr:hypothetical protein GBA52_028491 [Prunus armeniaca]
MGGLCWTERKRIWGQRGGKEARERPRRLMEAWEASKFGRNGGEGRPPGLGASRGGIEAWGGRLEKETLSRTEE